MTDYKGRILQFPSFPAGVFSYTALAVWDIGSILIDLLNNSVINPKPYDGRFFVPFPDFVPSAGTQNDSKILETSGSFLVLASGNSQTASGPTEIAVTSTIESPVVYVSNMTETFVSADGLYSYVATNNMTVTFSPGSPMTGILVRTWGSTPLAGVGEYDGAYTVLTEVHRSITF